MRRALAALVLLALPIAGCSVDRDGEPQAGASPSVSASAGGTVAPSTAAGGDPAPGGTAKAGGNAKQVCADAVKSSSTGTLAYVDQLGKMLQAAGKGDDAGAKQAQQALEKALDTWSADLERLSGTATDARLKSTLGELAGEVDKMGAEIDSVDDAKLGAIQDRLDQLCPQ
jgi:hypothetical protein